MFKSFNRKTLLSCMLLISIIFAGCSSESTSNSGKSETVELMISAAASMTDALTEIREMFEDGNPGIKLSFNFGASGALQQQIEQGAPVDLFLSAAVKNMTALVYKQLIDPNEQMTLLRNELVVVIPASSAAAVNEAGDLTKQEVKIVAIGIPESVPAGSYAKEALINMGLWERLEPKTVQGKDVRQVLQYVETGNADAGFVYQTDALTSNKVKIAFTLDSAGYTPILYPIGIIKGTKHPAEAERFYHYLQSQEAIAVFIKYGFFEAVQ